MSDFAVDRKFLHDLFGFNHCVGDLIFLLFIIGEVHRPLIRIMDADAARSTVCRSGEL